MTPAETVARVLRDNLPDDEPMWSIIVIAKKVVAALGLREELAAEFNEHTRGNPMRIPYDDLNGIDWFRDNNPNIGPVRAVSRYVTNWQEVNE